MLKIGRLAFCERDGAGNVDMVQKTRRDGNSPLGPNVPSISLIENSNLDLLSSWGCVHWIILKTGRRGWW